MAIAGVRKNFRKTTKMWQISSKDAVYQRKDEQFGTVAM